MIERPTSNTLTPAPESRTIERPTALLLEQLMQVGKTSALQELASGIAYEVNEPLGAIAIFAQAAQRMLKRSEPMVDAAIEVLQHINQEAFEAGQELRRTRSLLDAHRNKHCECDVTHLIDELSPVLDLLAQRKGGTLTLTVHRELPLVAIDRLRIQHVLFALVQNALEASVSELQSAEVRIDVTGDGDGVSISVEDRGLDVDEAVNRTSFASDLAVAEEHHGSLTCQHVEPRGARFVLRLPAVSKQQFR